MRIINIVNSFIVVMLLVALGGIAVAFWSGQQMRHYRDRVALAHRSYDNHLLIAADTYLLFKRYADFALDNSTASPEATNELIARLRRTIGETRAIILKDVVTVGPEERRERELLTEIEQIVETLITRYRQHASDPRPEDPAPGLLDLSRALSKDIKRDFRILIADALQSQERQMAQADALAQARLRMTERVGLVAIALFLLITLVALVTFRLRIALPLRQLMTGVHGFAHSDFSREIELRRRDELGEIAGLLNRMAAAVTERTDTLTARNEQLDQAVKARTRELERLLSEAQKAEENRRQLLADVSHELRTPLTVIQGESDVALRGAEKTADEYREALRNTKLAAAHTAKLVDDLLFIARNEAGAARLNLETFDLAELLIETAELSENPVKTVMAAADPSITADRTRIRQLVLALLHNARNHGGHDVTVRLVQSGSSFVLSVEDDGPGLPDSEKERVFERYFRGSNASDRYAEGLGLGLPMVRSIAEAHGGSARIEDREGGGTVARVELPFNLTGWQRH